jgi:HlyD family secretion protein
MRHAQQVIRAGEVLAQIAPVGGAQQVKLKVPSRDIGTIKANQDAYLRISGCPYPDFGVMKARVISVSADTLVAESESAGSPAANFEVVLKPSGDHLQTGSRRCVLRHGMDVQADIITRRTTVLGSLLTKLRLFSGT